MVLKRLIVVMAFAVMGVLYLTGSGYAQSLANQHEEVTAGDVNRFLLTWYPLVTVALGALTAGLLFFTLTTLSEIKGGTQKFRDALGSSLREIERQVGRVEEALKKRA
jgi:hypothetical protein